MAITDYSKTASSNTTVAGVNIQGTAPASNLDNAIRSLMADIATALEAGTFSANGYVAKSGAYTVVAGDRGKVIDCTAALELDLTAAATLGAGFMFYVKANGGAVTVDPNGTENINGASASLVVPNGAMAVIVCTGSAWHSMVTYGAAAVESAAISVGTGQETIYIPAAAMTPNVTAAPALGVLTASDVCVAYLAFDPTTTEFAQFQIQMPKGWNLGTLVVQFVWTHPATTTNFGVAWAMAAYSLRNDDAIGATYPIAPIATDTGGTTNDVYISPEVNVTPGGTAAAESLVTFRLFRYPSDPADNLAVDAYLLGVKVHYTTNALTDD